MKTHEGVVAYKAPKKYFGVFGQGTADGLGYDVNKDDPDNAQCSNRYFSINLIPMKKDNLISVTSPIGSVKAFANTSPDLAKPTAPKAPTALKADPTRAETGASYIAVASAAAVSLAALTLY